MRNRLQTTEIIGTCAQIWGGILVPTAGTVSVKIDSSNLHTTVKSGFEKKESWTRIQNIDSVEVHATPAYALLILGVFFVLMGLGGLAATLPSGATPLFSFVLLLIGIVFTVFSMINKQRYLAIYSTRYTIPLFMKGSPDAYQQFAIQVMDLADKLNKPDSVSNG